MAVHSLSDLKHDKELAEALGHMVVAWAHAEVILLGALTRILGSNLNLIQAGYYRIPTFEARIKFMRALLTEWKTHEFDKDAADHEIGKLAQLALMRNQWVHGDWCIDDQTQKVIIFDQRAALDSPHRSKPVKAADVLNHIGAVRKRADAIAALLKIYDLPP